MTRATIDAICQALFTHSPGVCGSVMLGPSPPAIEYTITQHINVRSTSMQTGNDVYVSSFAVQAIKLVHLSSLHCIQIKEN